MGKGEVGNWLAYPKIGKTTMLIQHGRAATSIGWKKVYHAVFEGSRDLVENRISPDRGLMVSLGDAG